MISIPRGLRVLQSRFGISPPFVPIHRPPVETWYDLRLFLEQVAKKEVPKEPVDSIGAAAGVVRNENEMRPSKLLEDEVAILLLQHRVAGGSRQESQNRRTAQKTQLSGTQAREVLASHIVC